MPTIDECLSVEDAVTPDNLADSVGFLLAAPPFSMLVDSPEAGKRIIDAFRKISLDPLLVFKLSLARDQFPQIFSHSLEVAVCAAIIAQSTEGKFAQNVTMAAASGLFHDLGLLHIDPEILRSERDLSDQDRQHIYSHPVIAYLILSKVPEWHPTVSSAVLEHHERIC
ncbi:HD domain-containing protein [Dechloromonas sp. HYN0024]|nr:HD domain-containing protein [Dechloromonas sp. HYN0024]